MDSSLTSRMVVPIANETDAERTCDAIERELSGDLERRSSTIVAVHVIEKGDGAPDKAPMEARTEQAERIFEVVTDRLESDRCRVETELVYGTDIVDTLRETAEETNATSIVFLPRPNGFFARFLSGNLTRNVVANAPVPVITLPTRAD